MAKNKRKTLDDVSEEVGTVLIERKRIRKTVGKETRKGFQEFIVELLRWNEQPKNRFNDDKLKSMVLREFGHSADTLRSFQDGCTSMAKLRNEYNRRIFHAFLDDNGKNSQISCKYNDAKKPLNTSKPTIPATVEDLKAYHERYQPVETLTEFLTRLGFAKHGR